MSEIKSWWERMPFGADDLKADYMQSEIDELRAALAERDSHDYVPQHISAIFNGYDIKNLPPVLISAVAKLWPGSGGMFWENNIDLIPARIEQFKDALADAEKDAGYYRKLRSGDVDNYAVADLRDGIFNGEVYGTALDQAMQGGE